MCCLEDNLEGTGHNSHSQFCKCWNLIKPFLQPTGLTRSWHVRGVSVMLRLFDLGSYNIPVSVFRASFRLWNFCVCVCVGQLPLQCLQTSTWDGLLNVFIAVRVSPPVCLCYLIKASPLHFIASAPFLFLLNTNTRGCSLWWLLCLVHSGHWCHISAYHTDTGS